jgi:hypothetical protein
MPLIESNNILIMKLVSQFLELQMHIMSYFYNILTIYLAQDLQINYYSKIIIMNGIKDRIVKKTEFQFILIILLLILILIVGMVCK